MFSPPLLMVWSMRPITVIKPSLSATAASPEKYQPLRSVSAVLSGKPQYSVNKEGPRAIN